MTSIHRHDDDLARASAILRGDGAAFTEFYRQAFPRLYRYAVRHCGDAALAEEVTQQSLVTALEKLDGYRGESSLLTWLFTIERRQLERRGALDARVLTVEDDVTLNAALAAIAPDQDADAAPARIAARSAMTRRVPSALDRLPPLYAECLEAKYVLGLSVREMAERQRRSEKAIESTLGRAREAFRDVFLTLTGGEVSQ
ncbi:MAG: RNA polymerase sigma factor [Pseudomonadota bacterium]